MYTKTVWKKVYTKTRGGPVISCTRHRGALERFCAQKNDQAAIHFSFGDKGEASITTKQGTRELVKSTNARHVSWLRKVVKQNGKRKTAWRPKVFYRRGAFRWLVQQDNVQRVATANGGLRFIIPDPTEPLWKDDNWRDWPTQTYGIDQGSDGVAALHALMYKLRGNVSPFYEFSHGCNNDTVNLYKQLGVYNFCLVTLCIMNVHHGPDKDEGMRHEQYMQMLKAVLNTMSCEECALFQHHVGHMIEDMADEFDIDPSIGPAKSFWNWMSEHVDSMHIGDRVKTKHYMGWWSGAKRLTKRWHLELFLAEMLCLEQDWFQGSKFMALPVVTRQHVAESDATRTTSTRITQLDSKILRGSTANNAVTAAVFLAMDDYQIRVCHMVLFIEPVKIWQGHAVKYQKNVEQARDWLAAGMRDSFLAHQKDMLSLLRDPTVLRKCGYFHYQQFPAAGDTMDQVIEKDDEFATFASDLVLGMCANRQRRMLYLSSCWPNRHFRALASTDLAQQVATEFREDYEVFTFWSRKAAPDQALKDMLARSPFQLTATKQYIAAFTELGFSPHPDIQQLTEDKARGVISSDVIEKIHGMQKNRRQAKGTQLYRRPQHAYAVMDQTYEYKVPQAQSRPNSPIHIHDYDPLKFSGTI